MIIGIWNSDIRVKPRTVLIASSSDVSKTVQSLESVTARQRIETITKKKMGRLLKQLAYHKARHNKESHYQVWQEGFHPQEIAGEGMLRQKIDYIHYNPVRRGYVRRPEDWVYSSAGSLLKGEKGVLELDPLPI